jgi:hypothetical protein
VLTTVFNRSLDGRLQSLALPPRIRERIESQRPKLAAIETDDPRGRQAIKEAFVDGYRAVLWIAAVLALGSSAIAMAMISGPIRRRP